MRPIEQPALLFQFVLTQCDHLVELVALAEFSKLWIVKRIEPEALGLRALQVRKSVQLFDRRRSPAKIDRRSLLQGPGALLSEDRAGEPRRENDRSTGAAKFA